MVRETMPPPGYMKTRDFAPMRQQVPLSELTGDARGDVWFACTRCPHAERRALADLRARFAPDAGLVNILNTLRPKDCPKSERNASGIVGCGFHYRDLARGPSARGYPASAGMSGGGATADN
ncbi:hypothetical protein [Phenylobacterium sp.]|uniref:hypothetical protein n=1 Tax=Phenylobacterium sp. TaxID=1871053 RepID=UPI001223E685|nr:hypothetical protein [Phenylobacterium sp.]THD56534.1 MAG: hypothetical protein E8A12_14340 [Phenylobacterium sp.]